ncbi:hypothetical protein TEA_002470 [Camellia sinensis var. sinensis]|uniref:Uncharacterized protein n=1 Tax=Camellia sinensis var. sinensis TaxID=542762 RepID=A0A4S4DLS5_CAMSN|nr:hypothetical protein TEA_002470 [Camellia sinensis var. sinensis]
MNLLHNFSMFLSISLKEHPGLILSFGRLHFYGISNMQASSKGYVAAGLISNASVDVIQGRRSIEIRAVGITKLIRAAAVVDFSAGNNTTIVIILLPILSALLCCHFASVSAALAQGTLRPYEGESGKEKKRKAVFCIVSHLKIHDMICQSKSQYSQSCEDICFKPFIREKWVKASQYKVHRPLSTLEKRLRNHGNEIGWRPKMHDQMSVHEGSSVLDLRGDNYFSCAVGRKRSNARYLLGSSADVVSLFNEPALVSSSS